MTPHELTKRSAARPSGVQVEKGRASVCKGKIWIDLDNSPNVPFFAPIVKELEKRDYAVLITVRDCFQVRELAELFCLNYRLIGRHHGKSKIWKMAGLCVRALELIPTIAREQPDLAVSVCSRSQLILSKLWYMPTVFMGDYEFSTAWAFVRPNWLVCPEVIPDAAIRLHPSRILKYPGIKEDVYVPQFVPGPSIRPQLGLLKDDVVATIRPPASEAHYHNPESDKLFDAAVTFLSKCPGVKLVALPRNERQAIELQKRWSVLLSRGTMLIPNGVINGLNLIWHSDLVISAGGTMNREAAALGVPVYSVFRGRIGAVDQYLADRGRLVLLESDEDVLTKIVVARRNRPDMPKDGGSAILHNVVERIIAIMEKKHASPNTLEGFSRSQLDCVHEKRAAGWSGAGLTK